MNFLEKENAKIDDVASNRGEKSSNDNRSQKKALYVGTNSQSRSNANQAEPNKAAWRKGKGSSKSQNSSFKRRHESEISNSDCPSCPEKHPLFLCAQFKAKKTEDRRKIVESLKRCVNCLSPGDCTNNSCKSSRRCYVCDEMHHTLLHRDKNYSMGQEDKGSSKKVMMGTKKSTKATVMFATGARKSENSQELQNCESSSRLTCTRNVHYDRMHSCYRVAYRPRGRSHPRHIQSPKFYSWYGHCDSVIYRQ